MRNYRLCDGVSIVPFDVAYDLFILTVAYCFDIRDPWTAELREVFASGKAINFNAGALRPW